MALDFYYIFRYLESVSFFQIVVPFLLVFIVIFALLEKTGIFGRNTHPGVNIMVSFLLSAIAIVNTNLVVFMNTYLGNITVSIILVSVTLLLFQFLMGDEFGWAKYPTFGVAILAVIFALTDAQSYSSMYGGRFGDFWYYLSYLSLNQGLIVLVLIGIISVYTMAKVINARGRNNSTNYP